MSKNVIIGQSGGPTAVINSSLAGVYKAARSLGADKVYGMKYGIEGLLKEEMLELNVLLDDRMSIELLKRTPSSYLGSCRYKLPDWHEDEAVYKKLFAILEKLNIGYFFYIGGNDSMDTIGKLADYGAHIIHGAANAMYLPKVIAFNAKDPEAKKRYGVIADEMKLGGSNDDEKVKLLIEYLRGMNDALNIPHCIQHYGPDSYPTEQGFVPEEVFLERLPEIAKNAIGDACTGSNPRQPSQEEMEKLLKCCYYDTEVDF